MTTHICKSCKIEKPLTDGYFYMQNKGRNFSTECKLCFNQRRKTNYHINKSKQIQEQTKEDAARTKALQEFLKELMK